MPEVKLTPAVKPLHMGQSISDLKTYYNINPTASPKMLCNSAVKLYAKVIKFQSNGDQEQSYIDVMKYLSLVTIIQSSPDFKKNQKYFIDLLGENNMKSALTLAEDLQKKLQVRYEMLKEQVLCEAAQQEQEKKEAEEELKRKQKQAGNPHELFKKSKNFSNGLPDDAAISLTCVQLYSLLLLEKREVLVLDCRPAESFAQSKIKFHNVINIPQSLIKPGMTADALGRSLSPETRKAWEQRSKVPFVVLMDWVSNSTSLFSGLHLHTLSEILTRWDPETVYKRRPLILEGGFESWLLTYPMHTTDPSIKPPQENDALDDLLDDIEYPPLLDESDLAFPSVNRASKPLTQDGPEGGDKPGVDRGLKQQAVQTYEERSREVAKLLREREAGAEGSLLLERQRYEAEKEWEMTRLRREKDAEEELRSELQRKEESLMSNILQLEEQQKRMEAENEVLRKQLLEYKKREMEDSVSNVDQHREEEIGARIRKKEEERMKISRQADQLHRERERKVAEDRKRRIEQEEAAKRAEDEKKWRGTAERDKAGAFSVPLKDTSSSSSIKRSHSSPNISQMNDDDEIGLNHQAPLFDRSVKPQQKVQGSDGYISRQRNFNPVYGSIGPGLTGLKNLGNSCYMNSILQCINNTNPLANYFVEGPYRQDLNRQNRTKGHVAEEVAVVIRALWSNEYRSISCRDLKNAVGMQKDSFLGFEQQDSHEFLTMLMDWLHEDLNKTKGQTRNVVSDLMSPAEREWAKFKANNESQILKLFFGQQRSTVRCCRCSEESVTFEPFSNLSLPLPAATKCTLNDCIFLYLKEERLSGWNCPKCKEARDAIKKFDILKLPPVLIIHFKRFHHDGWSRKRQNTVEFPIEQLDMHEYAKVTKDRSLYNLYAVSNHYGTMEGGHYTAYCRNKVTGRWYRFDDHQVMDIAPGDIRTPAAYILFYTSIDRNFSLP